MTTQYEDQSQIGNDGQGIVKRWLLELQLAEKREKDWRRDAEGVWKRYRGAGRKKNSFNILWSNTETIAPAIYNSLPQPDVRRRFKDEDPVAKAAAEVLKRALEFSVDTECFSHNIELDVLDMLLPSRGVSRVKYVPSISSVEVEEDGGMAPEETKEQYERLDWEQVVIEHVQWDDIRFGPGKTWEEIPWIAFRHRLTKEQLIEKFGEEIGKAIVLDDAEDKDIKENKDDALKEVFSTACVWEFWIKDEKKVLFISASYRNSPLQEVDDPLNLQYFFPIPRPLYAISDSSSFVPTILFSQYKEQADELDKIGVRIDKIVNALKVRGIYDSTLGELEDLLRGEDNTLIPAQSVAALIEKGGLDKAIWMMPIETAASVLKELYIQREQIKQVIYEITGLGDIIRGQTNPNETATAQQIKSQWGSQRISSMQREVQRYVRDLLRMMAELIAEKFSPETLMKMTGLNFPTQEQVAIQYQQMAMQDPQSVQNFQPPVMLEQVVGLLRDDLERTFRVDVETDSTIAATIEADMQGMRDVMTGIVELFNGIGPAVQMGVVPVEALKELILAVCRRSKMGNAVEDALDKIQQPPPQQEPQDNSAEIAQIQEQTKLQIAQLKEESANQREMMKQQMENQRESQRLQIEEVKTQLDAAIKVIVANISAKAGVEQATLDNANREYAEDVT